MDNYEPERYARWDGPPLEQVLDREGATYTLSDARGAVANQESDIDAFVIVKGDADSVYADMQRRGIGEVLQPALDSGAIKIVGESYTVNWDPFQAEGEMDAILQKNANRIDAAIVEDDGMAAGVIKSLTEAGLAGKVAVSGAGGLGGFPSVFNFNAIARGVQTVDVWQDYRRLGRTAAEAAVELCQDLNPATAPAACR